jgi:hypothetical protein
MTNMQTHEIDMNELVHFVALKPFQFSRTPGQVEHFEPAIDPETGELVRYEMHLYRVKPLVDRGVAAIVAVKNRVVYDDPRIQAIHDELRTKEQAAVVEISRPMPQPAVTLNGGTVTANANANGADAAGDGAGNSDKDDLEAIAVLQEQEQNSASSTAETPKPKSKKAAK